MLYFAKKSHTSNGPFNWYCGAGRNQENNTHLPKSNFFVICQICNLKQHRVFHSFCCCCCSLLQMPLPEAEVSQGCYLNPKDFVFIELISVRRKTPSKFSSASKMKHNNSHVLLLLEIEFVGRKFIGTRFLTIIFMLINQYHKLTE